MTKKKQGIHFHLPWHLKTTTWSPPKPKIPFLNNQTRLEHGASSSDKNPHFDCIGIDPTQLTILSGSDNESDKIVVEGQEGSPIWVEKEIENPLNPSNETAYEPSLLPIISQSTLVANPDITPKKKVFQLEMGEEIEKKNETHEATDFLNNPIGSNVVLSVPLDNEAKMGTETTPSPYSEGNQTKIATSYIMNTDDTSELDMYASSGYEGKRAFLVKKIEEEIYKFVQQLRHPKKENIGTVITLVGENNGVLVQLGSSKEIKTSKRWVNSTYQGVNNSIEHNYRLGCKTVD